MKKQIHWLLGQFGLRISRAPRNGGDEFFPSLDFPFNVLEYLIYREINESDDFYFVQVGANDGILADQLNPLIKKYSLSGLLVEPMPDFFTRLQLNYCDQPQLVYDNCAIGLENGSAVLYRFSPDAPVPAEFYHGLARFDGNYICERARKVGLESYIEKLVVPVKTFGSLLADHRVDRLDLLYVDTEGKDKDVIDSAFRSGWMPKIIQYEWTEMNQSSRYQCKIMLLDHGYRFVDVGENTICIRECV